MLSRSDNPSATVAPAPSRADGGPAADRARPDKAFFDAGVAMAWVAHPAKQKPGRTALVFLAVSATWWIALAAFHSPFMAIVSSLAILGSVTEALFPIHHRISPDGISTRCAWQMRTMTWESVRSARHGADGIHLSPLASASRRSHIRGVTLRFADGNAPAVTALVRRYLDEARAPREKKRRAKGRK